MQKNIQSTASLYTCIQCYREIEDEDKSLLPNNTERRFWLMSRQIPRVPTTCPPGFQGRYTVQPGDTMFRIAQMFRTRLEALTVNNPHITNPNIIFPGDVLCVPAQVPIPCCIVLQAQRPLPFGTGGVAFVHFSFLGTQAVSFLANLPAPSLFGTFNGYVGEVNIPNVGTFGNVMFPTPEDPPTYALTLDFPTAAQLTPDSTVVIRPTNLQTGASGPILLQGRLTDCQRMC